MTISLVDVSGSMGGAFIAEASSHITGRVIVFDHTVRDMGHGYIPTDRDVGGGSALIPAIRYIIQKYPGEDITIITDGYIFDAEEASKMGANVTKIVGIGPDIDWVKDLKKFFGI